MEVRFTPEQEARLSKIASREGVDPEELVKDAALRLLADDSKFRAGVRKGIEQADRGEFIEEEEMDERVKRMTSAEERKPTAAAGTASSISSSHKLAGFSV